MKGLENIPCLSDLVGAYNKLQHPHASGVMPLGQLCLYSQWVRFDPRLGELLVKYIEEHWQQLNPLEFNTQVAQQPWPAATAVLLEMLACLVPKVQKKLYIKWMQLVTCGVHPVDYQMFFIGTMKPGGKIMMSKAQNPSKVYLKWGFLENEILVNKAARREGQTLMAKENRILLIKKLAKEKSRFTVSDYIVATGGNVSRRQAELDLQSTKGIRAHGHTRARTYTMK